MKKIKKFLLFSSFILTLISLMMAGFFFVKMNQTDALLDAMINDVLLEKPDLNDDEKALLISDKIYRETNNLVARDKLDWYSKWEATSFFNMSAGVGLEYNCYGIEKEPGDGPCGTMTKIFLLAMWELDIPARKLQLGEYTRGRGGHTMAEFYFDGKWRVISPSDSSFVWRNIDGSIATVEEIQSDTSIFNQIYHKWDKNWPYGFVEVANINWEKLPNFMESIIKFLIGEEAYNNAETPKLYEQPRKFLFIIFVILFLGFLCIAIYISKSIPKISNFK